MADISAIKLPNGTTYNLKDTTARNAANSAVPNTRTVNGKALSSNISLGAGDVGAYTKKETDTKINAAIASAYKYKGSVTADKLPTSGQVVGDVYNITNDSSYGKAGMNVAWTGTTWDALGSNVDTADSIKTYADRPTSANKVFGDEKLRYFLATDRMTEGKPTQGDAIVLDLAWDNTSGGGRDKQLAVTDGPHLQIREMKKGEWTNWSTVYDESHKPTPSEIGALATSDVHDWAKAENKPRYSWNEINGKPSTFVPSSHTHTKDQVGLGNVANFDQSKAIKSITRSGTTFTATALDGTTTTFTQQDNNTTYGLASQSSNGLMSAADKKAIDREFFRMLPKGGTVIPNGANLNSTAYLKVGNYYQLANVNTTNMTNIPFKAAFIMYVLSPLSKVYDNESTAQ